MKNLLNRLARFKNGHPKHLQFQYHQLIIKPQNTFSFYIKPLNGRMEQLLLTIHGKNLFDGEYVHGYLKEGSQKIHSTNSSNYRTTLWFPVIPMGGKSLVLSGTAHNRTVWQFKTADGEFLSSDSFLKKFNTLSDVSPDRTVSKIDIPENAAYARVFFATLSDTDCYPLDQRLQIEYGKIPTSYEAFHKEVLTLPICEAECFFSYENNHWYLNTPSEKKLLSLPPLNLPIGSTVSVASNSAFTFEIMDTDVVPKKTTTGRYGIRYNTKDRNPICERVGDAKDLHFNATINNEFLTPYANDFDHIYPWSKIRVCTVSETQDGRRQVTYRNSKNFKRDGSLGDVMVEIPKFYTRREIIDDYDYLWICGEPMDSFEIDPSFVTKDGILDCIYIAAYHSTIKGKKLTSINKSYPAAKLSLQQIHSLLPKNSSLKECDLLSILTIQKLFIVESALLDSQSLFTGNVVLPYLLKDKNTSYYAIKSESASNRIFVEDTSVTRRFHEGDSVSLLKEWKEYKNIPGKFQRQITKIIHSKPNLLEIHFTGSPVDVLERETGITCIPSRNGKTDGIRYHTGAVIGSPGHSSFRYRFIENLWGNISIFLDSAYVLNSELYITYPSGETKKINYLLPIQNVQLWPHQFGSPTGMIIKKMGYDKENPLIMFPIEIGNGALTNSYYCDAWYNLGEQDIVYVLTFGGAWDNKGYAGIFNFRASFSNKSILPYNGSRLMMR